MTLANLGLLHLQVPRFGNVQPTELSSLANAADWTTSVGEYPFQRDN